MTVSGEVSGEIGGRNHFIDFDIDSTEFSDNCVAVASAIHLGCPVARSEAQGGYGMSADSTTCAPSARTDRRGRPVGTVQDGSRVLVG
jgi:hypothetical protein